MVSGSFQWANPERMLTTPGKSKYMAVFTPSDNETYREVSIYVNVNVTGTAITSGTADKNLTCPAVHGRMRQLTADSGMALFIS